MYILLFSVYDQIFFFFSKYPFYFVLVFYFLFRQNIFFCLKVLPFFSGNKFFLLGLKIFILFLFSSQSPSLAKNFPSRSSLFSTIPDPTFSFSAKKCLRFLSVFLFHPKFLIQTDNLTIIVNELKTGLLRSQISRHIELLLNHFEYQISIQAFLCNLQILNYCIFFWSIRCLKKGFIKLWANSLCGPPSIMHRTDFFRCLLHFFVCWRDQRKI